MSQAAKTVASHRNRDHFRERAHLAREVHNQIAASKPADPFAHVDDDVGHPLSTVVPSSMLRASFTLDALVGGAR